MTANSYKKLFLKTIGSVFFLLSLITIVHVTHAAPLSDNYNGTVTDLGATLMWQQCSAPSTETNCTISPSLYNWDNALAYCNGLTLANYTNWRLPNVKELHSLIDVTKTTAPSINTFIFPDTQSAYYWSSTTSVGTSSYAWYVDFNISGGRFVMTSGNDKTIGNYVRCVRGG